MERKVTEAEWRQFDVGRVQRSRSIAKISEWVSRRKRHQLSLQSKLVSLTLEPIQVSHGDALLPCVGAKEVAFDPVEPVVFFTMLVGQREREIFAGRKANLRGVTC